MNPFRFAPAVAGALIALALSSLALAQEPVRIAYIEGMSGPFANVGELGMRHLQIAIEDVNSRGGVLGGRKLELVVYDSKTSAQEAQLVFKQVVDRGIRYMIQGNGSSVALALSDAATKHNSRDPGHSVLFLNYAAVDPALTNDKCSFWHFRFDADADMKMQALTNRIAIQKNIKKVYLINQDYSFGQAVAKAAREMLARKRPDIEIVGDDLHPLGKVKDFSPYIAKIKTSGADSVITGNWGNDMLLLVKAGKDAGLNVNYYTYYAGGLGLPETIGDAGIDHLKQVTIWHANMGGASAAAHVLDYRKRFPDRKDEIYYSAIRTAIDMLAKAIDQAKSDDPLAVARALEGMKYEGDSGEAYMRADNHQLVQPLFISTLVKANDKDVKFDIMKSGLAFRTDAGIDGKDTVMPTTCKMQRP
jgi:branched-chain amino acid transport system substrate-binding protein